MERRVAKRPSNTARTGFTIPEEPILQMESRSRITVSCPFCGRRNRIDAARVANRPRCGECRRPLLVDRPVKVTDADFDAVIGGTDVPVLVDFYADWCGPCKTMAPALDELAAARAGTLLVAKLDTDRHPALSARFGIGPRELADLVA